MSVTRTPISAAASPAITVSIEEADRLASLAESASRGSAEVIGLLLDEIDRAELLPRDGMPTDSHYAQPCGVSRRRDRHDQASSLFIRMKRTLHEE
jgi:hypothetical protein